MKDRKRETLELETEQGEYGTKQKSRKPEIQIEKRKRENDKEGQINRRDRQTEQEKERATDRTIYIMYGNR